MRVSREHMSSAVTVDLKAFCIGYWSMHYFFYMYPECLVQLILRQVKREPFFSVFLSPLHTHPITTIRTSLPAAPKPVSLHTTTRHPSPLVVMSPFNRSRVLFYLEHHTRREHKLHLTGRVFF